MFLSHITSRIFLPSFLPVCECFFFFFFQSIRSTEGQVIKPVLISGSMELPPLRQGNSVENLIFVSSKRARLARETKKILISSGFNFRLSTYSEWRQLQGGEAAGFEVRCPGKGKYLYFADTLGPRMAHHYSSAKVKWERFKVKKGLLPFIFFLSSFLSPEMTLLMITAFNNCIAFLHFVLI